MSSSADLAVVRRVLALEAKTRSFAHTSDAC